MSSAYGFTEDSARRIARVVKSVEGDTTEPTRIGPMLGGSTMSVVKVTALGSPLNTGQRVDYHASANSMNNINEVKVREVNGLTLKVNNYYVAFFSGYTSIGQPVFLVHLTSSTTSGSESGSGSGSESGSESGSGSGGGSGSGSGSFFNSGSGGGSGSGSGSNSLIIEVVTNVECVDGDIIVTKSTISIPGGELLS